jgi:hypothetical protein
MRLPGDTKKRPPGGGAAGRAKQFYREREPSKEDSKESEANEKAGGDIQKKASKTRSVKPK